MVIGCGANSNVGLPLEGVAGNPNGAACTDVATPGLIIWVQLDGQSAESLQVSAIGQSGTTQLVAGQSTTTAVSFFGAFNSPGTYTVSISYEGQTSSSSAIAVSQAANGCGVNTVTLNAQIQGNQVVILP